jgi:hypothetical protein
MKRKNLRKLAEYLLSLPEDYKHFNMGRFYCENYRKGYNSWWNNQEPDEIKPTMDCGTVACALGHGISAGIKRKKSHTCWFDLWRGHYP